MRGREGRPPSGVGTPVAANGAPTPDGSEERAEPIRADRSAEPIGTLHKLGTDTPTKRYETVGTPPTAVRASPGPVPATLRLRRLRGHHVVIGLLVVLASCGLAISVGAVSLPPQSAFAAILDRIPGVDLDSGLTRREDAIVMVLRLPRVVLGALVGTMLALGGAAYQGAFRNPLADPYLLGAAAGGGLGATLAIVTGVGHVGDSELLVPVVAFVGSLTAVALTYLIGAAGERSSPAMLVLAGVAVTAFFTAVQTFVQQQNIDDLREVYSWILGQLTTAGWSDVLILLPYAVLSAVLLFAHARVLDVMAIGDEEARALGMHPRRARLVIVLAASLGTAAAVSVSGLIGFVGVIVPHVVRLLVGFSYRVVLPLSALLGAALLVLADLVARTAMSPAELPIGVVTAFLGAPFFLVLLRTARRWTP